MKKLFVSCLLALTGCTTVFHKEGASQADYQREFSQCDYEVSLHTQGVDNSYRTMVGQEVDAAMRKRDLIVKCMQNKGWEARRQ